jgi:hypothetical protein
LGKQAANQETSQRQEEPTEAAKISDKSNHIRRWCYYACGFLWVAGSVVGFVGTVAIIIPVFNASGCIAPTIGVFFVPGAGGIVFIVSFLLPRLGHSLWKLIKSPGEAILELWDTFIGGIKGLLFFAAVGVFVFGLLYMDWSIGLVAGNVGGVPSKTNSAIFWTWFALKRLGLFAA